MEEIKECKTCGEEVKVKALKCPHCQTWQSKWKYDPSNPKHQLILTVALIGFMALLFSSIFGNVFNSKPFTESKELIEIKNTNLSFKEKSCGTSISVIGTITNNSGVTWKDVYFEARFFNSDDELIDTISDHDYDLVLSQDGENTFKVTGAADKDEASYHHHEIIIKDARENTTLF